VIVQDCPEPASCVIIGEDDNVHVTGSVPPEQARAFDGYVFLSNMPTPKKMVWNYQLLKVKAEVP